LVHTLNYNLGQKREHLDHPSPPRISMMPKWHFFSILLLRFCFTEKKSYFKHLRQCFISYPNTSNSVKNTLLHIHFPTLFGYPNETLSVSCVWYFIFNTPVSDLLYFLTIIETFKRIYTRDAPCSISIIRWTSQLCSLTYFHLKQKIKF